MLTVILRDGDQHELERTSAPGNSAYLIQRDGAYEYLSELSEFSFDTFGAADMPALVEELSAVRESRTDPSERGHLDEVIALARRVPELPGATLTFAPSGPDAGPS
jgi:hypothetical protein